MGDAACPKHKFLSKEGNKSSKLSVDLQTPHIPITFQFYQRRNGEKHRCGLTPPQRTQRIYLPMFTQHIKPLKHWEKHHHRSLISDLSTCLVAEIAVGDCSSPLLFLPAALPLFSSPEKGPAQGFFLLEGRLYLPLLLVNGSGCGVLWSPVDSLNTDELE